MNIIKISKYAFVCLALFCIFSTHASAYEKNEKINWFFKSEGGNTRPKILGGSNLPDEYDAIYMGGADEKTVYLTFDAGYSNENLEVVLDTLSKHEIQGAFFILPGIIKNSPDTVKRMANDGHLVCNHSTSHRDMSKITDIDAFRQELSGVEELYRQATGHEMEKFFRPPEGSFSATTLEFCKELGYTPVFWSFAYVDWDDDIAPNIEKAKANIYNRVHNGCVMLLHPTSKVNALILDDVITHLKGQGYTFGSLQDLAQNTK